jgi:hypothetical protein
MFSRKRPVVQLTSLLDLLFIMIFIALTVPPQSYLTPSSLIPSNPRSRNPKTPLSK